MIQFVWINLTSFISIVSVQNVTKRLVLFIKNLIENKTIYKYIVM